MSTERDANGRFRRRTPPAPDSGPSDDVVTEYHVNVPAFILWPIHAVAWLVATVVRFVALALLVAVLIALLGWWRGGPATAPPAPLPASCVATVATWYPCHGSNLPRLVRGIFSF